MIDIAPLSTKSTEPRIRILSAVVLSPIVLSLAYIGGWPFAFLLAACAIMITFEISALLPDDTTLSYVMLAFCALVAVLFTAVGSTFVALLIGMAGLAFSISVCIVRNTSLWPKLVSYPYLILPLVSLLWLRLDPIYGRIVIFWLLFVVWTTDTFAYFVGRYIGGPRLVPRISPNKTWAGLIGGMFGAIFVGVVTAIWFDLSSPILLALVSASIAIVAQVGDIFESVLKRRADVKDSGKLIPGHGGILDRVDGLIAAAVAAAILACLHRGQTPGAGVLIWC